jgi:hypothetical protein
MWGCSVAASERGAGSAGDAEEPADPLLALAVYQFARRQGCDEAEAHEAARLAVEQAPIRAQQLVEFSEWMERRERAASKPTPSLPQQLELWSKRGRGWEDKSQDNARIQSMYAAGATPDAVTDAIYPYRRDLIVRGRRSPFEQVEYAKMMAELSQLIESARAEATPVTRGKSSKLPGVNLDPAEGLTIACMAPETIFDETIKKPTLDDLVESALRGLKVIRDQRGRRIGPTPHHARDMLSDRERVVRSVEIFVRLEGGESWNQVADDTATFPLDTLKRWDRWLREEWANDPLDSGLHA